MADQTRSELHLPASIRAAWGIADRPAKGPKPGLSLDRIVEAAIASADADGFDALSMSRVAGQLGTAPMSLYRYVAAKGELLDLVLDAVYGPPPDPPDSSLDWRSGLTLWATTQLARLREHMWAIRIPISGPPITPNQIRWLEFGLRTLRDTGLSQTEKRSTILLVSGFVRNWVSLTADLSTGDGAELSDQVLHYAQNLRALVDKDHFPELTGLIASGTLEGGDIDEDYAFGLERILDGIGVLVRARR